VRLPRVRFTIRTLMIAVLAVGGLLASLTVWADLLPLFILVVIPLTGLGGLIAQVPPQRPAWRLGISVAMLGLIILGGGWLWARSLIWYWQWEQGLVAIGAVSREANYHFWGLTIPSRVTAICLMVVVLRLAVGCAPRRRRSLLFLVAAYALALAGAWVLLFADLELEAFD
jgi:hypothetical protein